MKLDLLTTAITQELVSPLPENLARLEVTGIHCRSNQVGPGGLFVAIEGFAADGHDYAPEAVARGAVAVVCQKDLDLPVPAIRVRNPRKALAELAAAFYGHPSRKMKITAITGTNGKTTTAYILESMLKAAGFKTGVIGTVNYRFGGRSFDSPVTTPESVDLQQILARMKQAGTTHVVMEVSSHALDLFRVQACDIDLAVFTNLSRDHLDYHHTMDRYWLAKRSLFTRYLKNPGGKAVINIDDARGRNLASGLDTDCLTCSLGKFTADISVHDASLTPTGTQVRLRIPDGEIAAGYSLIGAYNLENLACATGAAWALDLGPDDIRAGIENLKAVPGRLEPVTNNCRRNVYVDYAHSPDALENVLQTLGQLTGGRLICVFGCGGDRDAGKRPEMGRIAAANTDLVVVTSDNPRSEDPMAIIDQITAGIGPVCLRGLRPGQKPADGCRCIVEPDRQQAIELAIRLSRPEDTVLIAGKGHETYQILGNTRIDFDDREKAAAALKLLENNRYEP